MSSDNRFLGLWLSGTGAEHWYTGDTLDQFKARDQTHFSAGLRLTSMRVHDGVYTGIWRPGSGHQRWTPPISHHDFVQLDMAHFNAGLRLVDIEVDGGEYAGVWRPGSGGQHWRSDMSADDFAAQEKTYFDQGYRLSCLRVTGSSILAVWHPGTGHQKFAVNATYADFNQYDAAEKNAGSALIDIELHGDLFTGIWRPASTTEKWHIGDDFEKLSAHDFVYFNSSGLRLHKLFPYHGTCDSDCLNQVLLPTGNYDYVITGDPFTDGYHWPCVKHDGNPRIVRLSAVDYKHSPNFTLPFTDTDVHQSATWLYKAGNFHHAMDFSNSRKSFDVHPAADGKVIFMGWDAWSGNTMVISHEVNGVPDAWRTIYMHLRNGPTNDANNAWGITVPKLSGVQKTQYEHYLNATGVPKGGPYHPMTDYWGTDADKLDTSLLHSHVTTSTVIGHAGCTGPGGCNCTDTTDPDWTWNGKVNTHLHIFFCRRDPGDNSFYFIDPYGIYAPIGCYPDQNETIPAECRRYPIAWKGNIAQFP